MSGFILIFDVLCLIILFFWFLYFLYQKRKETSFVRYIIKLVKKSPAKWTFRKKECCANIEGVTIKIGKEKDGSYLMFSLPRTNMGKGSLRGKRINRLYKQMSREKTNAENTIKKRRRKVRRNCAAITPN